jgi:acetyltransferase
MHSIRRISASDHSLNDGLVRLLIDSVDGGASLGFLSPLSPATAARYWQGVFSSLGDGLVLWVAEQEGEIVGSVQLARCQKENGLHRAEVQKLLVLSSARRRGIAAALMAELEAFARADKRSLLVLDTLVGSPAEVVYQRLHWQRAGEIPGYAASPDGALHATAYYFKQI